MFTLHICQQQKDLASVISAHSCVCGLADVNEKTLHSCRRIHSECPSQPHTLSYWQLASRRLNSNGGNLSSGRALFLLCGCSEWSSVSQTPGD